MQNRPQHPHLQLHLVPHTYQTKYNHLSSLCSSPGAASRSAWFWKMLSRWGWDWVSKGEGIWHRHRTNQQAQESHRYGGSWHCRGQGHWEHLGMDCIWATVAVRQMWNPKKSGFIPDLVPASPKKKPSWMNSLLKFPRWNPSRERHSTACNKVGTGIFISFRGDVMNFFVADTATKKLVVDSGVMDRYETVGFEER